MRESGSTRRRAGLALAGALLAMGGAGGEARAFDSRQSVAEPPAASAPAAERMAQGRAADRPASRREGANAPFDYYVLALSWSPTYCADEARNPDSEPQCAPRRRYGFVVHGLWPQHEKGWPEFCGDPGWVKAETLASVDGIVPSRRLATHQWRKHGTCSGLDAEAYFATLREAWGKVRINEIFGRLDRELRVAPKVVEEAFLEANPGFVADGVTVECRGGMLREVRVCFDRNLEPRACAPDARRDCSAQSIRLPPLR
ncbi:ribonuclease T2 [Neomegalonema sp.]|uniref:ribonuclease T2 n=1 Tax=Neomegalonema sp. TaxID=2039713 RepID=UPI0026149FA9|nr:ribonuclease T2 [Neomegalonema sp.]MDD2867566.1 ribonuclease T2 [Neomegalonema sp.]